MPGEPEILAEPDDLVPLLISGSTVVSGFGETAPVTTSPNSPDPARSLRSHEGAFAGAVYKTRFRPLAREFGCDLCPDPAAFWDHCHDHGSIRGPLCRSCNGSEFLWPHADRGVGHLMACPGCRERGYPPSRNRVGRIVPTLGLLLDHFHTSRTGCSGRWAEGADREGWAGRLRDLSAGHLLARVTCADEPREAHFLLSVSRERFEVLDRIRVALGVPLGGQPYCPEGVRWTPAPTPLWYSDVLRVPAVRPEAEMATVAVPGSYGRLLEASLGPVFDDAFEDLRWLRRGRSGVLQVTSDAVGLRALLLFMTSGWAGRSQWEARERNGHATTFERIGQALADLQAALPLAQRLSP
ncbi:endonuclease domain-containing protein [Streptomyces sp. CA-111067]|uniref:endonuclease domain-containing protein n=1 Tax=Streptomyces sp. CA-111067 TaxID=3240046 RepID=UPI003D96B32B